MLYREGAKAPSFFIIFNPETTMSDINQNQNDDSQLDDDADLNIHLRPRIVILKERATRLGIKFSPNIGEDALAKKIEDHNTKTQGLLADSEGALNMGEGEAVKPLTDAQKRAEARMNANKLVRVNVHPNDPMRQQLRGELVWAGNLQVGTIGKYVPFGTSKGYHVPKIILDVLKDRMFTAFVIRKDKYGNDVPRAVQRRAYTIEELPPLSQKEIDKIATRQLAMRTWEEEQEELG